MSVPSPRRRPRRLGAAVLTAGVLLCGGASDALAQDPPAPPPACGPGQVPTPQNPCIPVHAWPDPAGSSQACASAAIGPGRDCPDATVSMYGSPVATVHTGQVEQTGWTVYYANQGLPCVHLYFGCVVGSG